MVKFRENAIEKKPRFVLISVAENTPKLHRIYDYNLKKDKLIKVKLELIRHNEVRDSLYMHTT